MLDRLLKNPLTRTLALALALWMPVGLAPTVLNAAETVKILAQFYPPLANVGVVTISNASPGVVTFTGSNLAVADQCVFTTTGGLPTGLTAGTPYFVISAGLGANSFQVSATKGGSAINTSSAGSGTHTANCYQTLYTPSGSNTAVISTITVANLSASNDTFKISIHVADAALANKMFIAGGPGGAVGTSVGVTVPANDTVVLTLGITLANTDVIHVWSQNGTSAFGVFGVEVQ